MDCEQGIWGLRAMQGLEGEWSRLLGQSGSDGDSLTMGLDVPPVARASP